MFDLFFRVFLLRGPIRKSGSWHSAAPVVIAGDEKLKNGKIIFNLQVCYSACYFVAANVCGHKKCNL
jgi:hypothetical protein